MKTRILGMLAFGLLATLASDVKANLVLDGNFSTPTAVGPFGFATYGAGSTFGNWGVVSGTTDPGAGSVDLLGSQYGPFPGGTGAQGVDLDGTSSGGAAAAGGITQTIGTTGNLLTVGATYVLDFFYALNPGATTASAAITIGGLSTSVTATTTAYTEATFTFTASSTTQLLSFKSLDPATQQSGVFLANVSINPAVAVPEPASFAMLGLGLVTVGAFARSRRRTA